MTNPPPILLTPAQQGLTKDDVIASICRAFEAVLQVPHVEPDDYFENLGGSHVTAILLQGSCPNFVLHPNSVLEGKTPRHIAALVPMTDLPVDTALPMRPSFPLNDTEMEVFRNVIECPESRCYNLPMCIFLPKELGMDAELVSLALIHIINSHPILKATFGYDENGEPAKFRHDGRPAYAPIIDVTKAEFEQLQNRVAEHMDLSTGPLCRYRVYRMDEGIGVMGEIHHIVADGTSYVHLFHEMADLIHCIIPEREEFIFSMPSWHDCNDPATNAEFLECLKGKQSANIPFDHPMPANPHMKARGYYWEDLNEGVTATRLRPLLRKWRLTENAPLLGAFAVALGIMAGTDDPLYYTCSSGRNRNVPCNACGMMVRTLPITTRIDPSMTVEAFLQNLQHSFFHILRHQDVSFWQISDRLKISQDVLFVYQADLVSSVDIDGHAIQPHLLPMPDLDVNLDIQAFRMGDTYRMMFEYASEIYDESTIRRFTRLYNKVLAGFRDLETIGEVLEHVKATKLV